MVSVRISCAMQDEGRANEGALTSMCRDRQSDARSPPTSATRINREWTTRKVNRVGVHFGADAVGRAPSQGDRRGLTWPVSEVCGEATLKR